MWIKFAVMIRKTLFLILGFFSIAFTSQSQQYEIGLSSGMLTPMDFWYYQEGRPGFFTGIAFSYISPKKLVISTNIAKGGFQFNPALSEYRVNGQKIGPENSKVDVYFFYLGVGKGFNLKKDLELIINSGFGYFLENRLAFNESDIASRGAIQYYKDATFPIQAEIRKELVPNLWLGLKSGVFLTPFYTFGGFHLTPNISFRL
jgi:hypothetical protein